MRLTDMNRRQLVIVFATALAVPFAATPLTAQRIAGESPGYSFKDTSMLKPPPGARVAVIEWEDLGCPACAHAYPIVHAAVAHFNIPLMRKDFPLAAHIWTFDAAVWARYLQDRVSPKTADDYRAAVFAAQMGISSKDDMLAFTRRFFQPHGVQMPFVPDPTGQLAKEVKADYDLGEKLGVQQTPTIIVCTQHQWVQITNPSLIYQTISEVVAQTAADASEKPAGPKKTTVAAKKSQ